MSHDDYVAIAGVLEQYCDQDLDLADASLMWLAERERVAEVFTTDTKDFGVFRTSLGDTLKLIGTGHE